MKAQMKKNNYTYPTADEINPGLLVHNK